MKTTITKQEFLYYAIDVLGYSEDEFKGMSFAEMQSYLGDDELINATEYTNG